MKNKIIIGAGLYGLYCALLCAKKGESVLVLECDGAPFERATYINQARIHMGYHYPRSISTAVKSKGYFYRFCNDYDFCIHSSFEQIYATSTNFSWTDAQSFRKFCDNADIRCDPISTDKYFNPSMCDGAFSTIEYTYDAKVLKKYFIDTLKEFSDVTIKYNAKIASIIQRHGEFVIALGDNSTYSAGFVINTTYAGVNQIHAMLGFNPFNIKYELCEIILCKASDNLKNVGITVMDGPFFSIMPFGKTGLHSLTSVTFTPHMASFDDLPAFSCQKDKAFCSPKHLGNCNFCKNKPETAWPYMSQLAGKYLIDKYKLEYVESLFSIKPILKKSEIDDSRPTVIRQMCENPTFISVLSGKINTMYDLDGVFQK